MTLEPLDAEFYFRRWLSVDLLFKTCKRACWPDLVSVCTYLVISLCLEDQDGGFKKSRDFSFMKKKSLVTDLMFEEQQKSEAPHETKETKRVHMKICCRQLDPSWTGRWRHSTLDSWSLNRSRWRTFALPEDLCKMTSVLSFRMRWDVKLTSCCSMFCCFVVDVLFLCCPLTRNRNGLCCPAEGHLCAWKETG